MGLERFPRGAAAAVALGVFLLDQALKAWALRAPLPCEVLPFLRFVLVINRGALFGLLAEGWASPLLLLFTALGTVAVGWLLWRARSPLARLALGLVLGGAGGNLLDRLRWGAVVDFVDLHWGGYHWPAFNLADAAITVGVGLLVVLGTSAPRRGGDGPGWGGDAPR